MNERENKPPSLRPDLSGYTSSDKIGTHREQYNGIASPTDCNDETVFLDSMLKSKLFYIFFFLFFFLSSYMLFSAPRNQAKIDSLLSDLQKSENDSEKASIYIHLCWEYSFVDSDKAIELGKKGLNLAKKIKYQKGIAAAWHNMGTVYYHKEKFDSAINYFTKSIQIREHLIKKYPDDLKTTLVLFSSISQIGNIYELRGNYPKALLFYLKNIRLIEKIKEEGNNQIDINVSFMSNLFQMGNVYRKTGNLSKSFEQYERALQTAKEMDIIYPDNYTNKKYLSRSLHSVGLSMHAQGKLDSAFYYYQQALAMNQLISKKLPNDIGNLIISEAVLRALGSIDFIKNAHPSQQDTLITKALIYLSQALNINQKFANKEGIINCFIGTGSINYFRGFYKEATDNYFKGLAIAQEMGSKSQIRDICGNLSLTYEASKNYEKAYQYGVLFKQLNDSIYNEESSKQIAEMQAKYESEKKEKEIELLNKEKALQDAQLNKNKIVTYSLSGGALLLLFVIFVIFRNYRIKQKANQKLEEQNTQITHQKAIIEEKNKDITDSIRYAKRIQNAMLPSDNSIQSHLPHSFVLYKPKDIVSGDFYWMEVLPTSNFQLPTVLFAVVDCTGHGVPGAFMSIVGENGLKRTVREQGIEQPSLILDNLNQYVEDTFSKSGGEVKDGMDIALCCLEFPVHSSELTEKNTKHQTLNTKLQFAGANNSLYLVRKGELTEIKGDKQPIGQYTGEKAFTNHTFELQKEDTLYLFSDGITDQFGGDKGKKFKYKQLKELLLSIQDKNMQEQKTIIENTIEQWKGNIEQIDDICMMGIRT